MLLYIGRRFLIIPFELEHANKLKDLVGEIRVERRQFQFTTCINCHKNHKPRTQDSLVGFGLQFDLEVPERCVAILIGI
jgi:hypothetical protein